MTADGVNLDPPRSARASPRAGHRRAPCSSGLGRARSRLRRPGHPAGGRGGTRRGGGERRVSRTPRGSASGGSAEADIPRTRTGKPRSRRSAAGSRGRVGGRRRRMLRTTRARSRGPGWSPRSAASSRRPWRRDATRRRARVARPAELRPDRDDLRGPLPAGSAAPGAAPGRARRGRRGGCPGPGGPADRRRRDPAPPRLVPEARWRRGLPVAAFRFALAQGALRPLWRSLIRPRRGGNGAPRGLEPPFLVAAIT